MRVLLEKSNQLINNSKQESSELLDLFQAIIFQNMLPQQPDTIQEDNASSFHEPLTNDESTKSETVDDLLQQVVVSYMVGNELAKNTPEKPVENVAINNEMVTKTPTPPTTAEALPTTPEMVNTKQNNKVVTTDVEKLTVNDDDRLLDDFKAIATKNTAKPVTRNNEILTDKPVLALTNEKTDAPFTMPVRQLETDARDVMATTTDKVELGVNRWMETVNISLTENKPSLMTATAVVVRPESSAPTDQDGSSPLELQMESVIVNKLRQDGAKETYVANIKVHPAELGPIQAKIQVNKDKVQISLLVKQAGVEDMIKNHLDTLVQQFTSQKMQVDSITIQTVPTAMQSDNHTFQDQNPRHLYQALDENTDTTRAPQPKEAQKDRDSSNLVDTYI